MLHRSHNEMQIDRNPLGTWKHGKTDAAATGRAADFAPIDYPKPDGRLSFDRLTSVSFSFTNHEDSQPSHLGLKDASVPIRINLPQCAEPRATLLPRGGLRGDRGRRGSSFRSQLPKLRPLQDLRHQGSQPEHHLDDAAGRRRPELREHVTGSQRLGTNTLFTCRLPRRALRFRERASWDRACRGPKEAWPSPVCPERAPSFR